MVTQAQYDAQADAIGRAMDEAQRRGDVAEVERLIDELMDLGARPQPERVRLADALVDMRQELARLREAVAQLQAEPLVRERVET